MTRVLLRLPWVSESSSDVTSYTRSVSVGVSKQVIPLNALAAAAEDPTIAVRSERSCAGYHVVQVVRGKDE